MTSNGQFPPGGPLPPGGPFQSDDGSGSRNTLIILAVVVVLVIAALAVAVVVVLRLEGKDRATSAAGPRTSESTTTTESVTSTTTTMTTTQPLPAAPGSTEVNVTVDGVAQNLNGHVACVAAEGNMNIAVGDPSGSSLGVVLTDADPPEVQTVGLVLNGNPLSYNKGGGGDATATKDGKTYTITGHAMGLPDLTDPTTPPVKPFEIRVTCP